MITIISLILVIIGAVNWFSVGVFDFNFINWIFQGQAYIGARIIYALVGVAGLWLVVYLVMNRFNARNINAIEYYKRDAHRADVVEMDTKASH